MNMFNMLLAALTGIGLVLTAPANGLTEFLDTPNKTYEVIDINWTIQINNTATSYDLNITGTIEDVFNGLVKADPVAAAAINNTINNQLHGRHAASNPTTTFCNIFTDYASASRIKQGITYLHDVPGKPQNGPGPGRCGKVSCSYNSAIWWCNDNKAAKVLDSFDQIADGAQNLFDLCNPNWKHASFSGQQFYDDGWNVIVRGTSC